MKKAQCDKCEIFEQEDYDSTVYLCPLHAAAPELLEAAKKIVKSIEYSTLVSLRQAIAKAEGK